MGCTRVDVMAVGCNEGRAGRTDHEDEIPAGEGKEPPVAVEGGSQGIGDAAQLPHSCRATDAQVPKAQGGGEQPEGVGLGAAR